MKKLMSILLLIACLLSGGCIAIAEDSSEETNFDQAAFDAFVECFEAFCKEYFAEEQKEESVDGDNLSKEIATMSPEEAYLTYAKSCILLISGAANGAYDLFISSGNYYDRDVVKTFVLAEDVFSIKLNSMRENTDNFDLSDIVKAREGYLSFKTNFSLLEQIMKIDIIVPNKYANIDNHIEEAESQLTKLDDTITNYLNGRIDFWDAWGAAEPRYLHNSINVLKGILYVDAMCD